MSALQGIGSQFFRHRRSWALFIVILNILAVWNIYSIVTTDGMPLDFSPQSIFIDNGEMVERLDEIKEEFGREDNDFLIVLQGEGIQTEDGKLYIETLDREIAEIEGIKTVYSLVDAKQITSTGGMIEVSELWDAEDPFQLAIEDQFLRRALVSEDGRTTVVQIRVQPEIQSIHDLKPVLNRIDTFLDRQDVPADIKQKVTGVPFIRIEVVDMMLNDNLFYIPITALIFLVTIIILFRGFWNAMTPVVAVLMSMLWSISFLLALGVNFNILSVLVPAISLIIGIADGIHVVARYREELLLDQDREQALGRTIATMFWACFLTSFTTAAGFASLMIADTIVIQDFGFHAAVAVMMTFLGVMMVIPVWLSFIPVEKIGSPVSESKWEEKGFAWLEALVWNRPRQIMAIFLLLTIGTGFYVSDMKANSNIMEMFHSEHPTRKAIEIVDSQLSGIVPIMISLEREDASVLDTDLLRKMQLVEAEMGRYDFVLWKYSLASQLEAIHYAFSEEQGLPNSSEMIAQELLMVEMAGDLPLDRILSEDQRLTRALFLCRDVGGIGFLAMKKEMDQKIAEVFGDQSNIRVELTGDGILASTGINKLILDLVSSIFLVFAVIFGVLLLMLRRFPMAIIALIPNALPLLLTLATLKMLGSDLQVTNIVSFTVAIGLAVDDTIHFVARYQSERQAGKGHREAMQASFHGAGHAIILTSILLVLGFGFLATSSLSSTSFFGILTAVTLIGAIFADLFLLPAMMNWWEGHSSQ